MEIGEKIQSQPFIPEEPAHEVASLSPMSDFWTHSKVRVPSCPALCWQENTIPWRMSYEQTGTTESSEVEIKAYAW